MKMKKLLAVILAALMIVSVFSSAAFAEETNTEPKEVTFGYLGSYSILCPSTGQADVADSIDILLVFDALFEIDSYTGEQTSRVLESYEWLDDTTLKLQLKKGIMFSDGTEMNGDDVISSLHRYIDNGYTEQGYYTVIDYDKTYVEDDYTIYLTYSEVNAAAISRLAVPIIPASLWEEHPDGDDAWWTGQGLIGSGPYTITDYAMDQYRVYEKKADYWDTENTFDADRIKIVYYTDSTALISDLNNGVVDVALNLDKTMMDIVTAQNMENITTGTIAQNEVAKLCYRNTFGPTMDINVRKALTHCVDWNNLCDLVYGVCGVMASSHYPSSFECYKEHDVYEYNVDLAKQYLADAGYAEGDLTMHFMATTPDQKIIGETLQFYYSQIGVNLVVEQVELFVAFSIMMEPTEEYSIMIKIQPGGNPALEPFDDFFLMDSVMNFPKITDPAYTEMMFKANQTADEEQRMAVYEEVDNYLYDEYQLIPVAELLTGFAYNNEVVADFAQSSIGVRGNLAAIKLQ